MQALPLRYVPYHFQARTLEFAVNQAKPLGYIQKPGHLLSVTFLKQELQPMNFAIIEDTGVFPPQQLSGDPQPSTPQYRREAIKATESPKMSSLRVRAHFPDTWSWLVYFQRRLQKIEAFEQMDGSGWSSPGSLRMGHVWGNIPSLVPAFMQPVVLQWLLLDFSREWTPPWHSTETERLFFALITYSRLKINISGDRRKITYENKEVWVVWQYRFTPVLLLENSTLHLIRLKRSPNYEKFGLKALFRALSERKLDLHHMPPCSLLFADPFIALPSLLVLVNKALQ